MSIVPAQPLDELTRDAHPERIRLLDLLIDPDYQRDIVRSRVKSIMAHFERHALAMFIVSRRADGRYYQLDGQQRRDALLQMGYGEMLVWCLVLEDLTPDEESNLFDRLNFDRTPVGAIIRFRNAVTRGDRRQTAIKGLVEGAGWGMPLKSRSRVAAGLLICVTTLEWCYDNAVRCDRLGAFKDSLEVAYDAYAGEPAATHGLFVKGLYLVCRDHWQKYDRDRLVEVLRPVHPDVILRQAAPHVAGKPGMSGFIAFVIDRYNVGLRGKRRLVVEDDEERG